MYLYEKQRRALLSIIGCTVLLCAFCNAQCPSDVGDEPTSIIKINNKTDFNWHLATEKTIPAFTIEHKKTAKYNYTRIYDKDISQFKDNERYGVSYVVIDHNLYARKAIDLEDDDSKSVVPNIAEICLQELKKQTSAIVGSIIAKPFHSRVSPDFPYVVPTGTHELQFLCSTTDHQYVIAINFLLIGEPGTTHLYVLNPELIKAPRPFVLDHGSSQPDLLLPEKNHKKKPGKWGGQVIPLVDNKAGTLSISYKEEQMMPFNNYIFTISSTLQPKAITTGASVKKEEESEKKKSGGILNWHKTK